MAGYGRPRTKELYNTVLAAYRTHGYQPGKVATVTGVHRNTAKRLWALGWPDRDGCTPIKDQIQMDQLLVRSVRAGADPEQQVDVAQQVLANSLGAAREQAKDSAEMLGRAAKAAADAEARVQVVLKEAEERLAAVEDLARSKISDAEKAAAATLMGAELEAKKRLADMLQKAKIDAAETMADEANAAKFARKAALSAAAIAALVLKDAQVIAAELRDALGGAKLKSLPPMQAVRIAREMMRLVEAAEKSVILALQAERLRLGEPTEVVGLASVEQSLAEREIKLKAVQRTIERQKAKLHVVNGGASGGQAGAAGAGHPSQLAGGRTA